MMHGTLLQSQHPALSVERDRTNPQETITKRNDIAPKSGSPFIITFSKAQSQNGNAMHNVKAARGFVGLCINKKFTPSLSMLFDDDFIPAITPMAVAMSKRMIAGIPGGRPNSTILDNDMLCRLQ
mmetsp:Transcript_2236/g.2702  ORF Transcript_2236/g.2702 Transcript_2236/m.2702 type:complete len:125 (+) Transcript_2236:446-820(+)